MRLDVFTATFEDPRVAYALIRVHADAADPAASGRRPLNLTLVIDRSSSMRGPRLAQAILAVERLVERLDERDRLAVVAFDATARVVLPPGPVTDDSRARLLASLKTLGTGAGTNLAAGWKKGCELAAAGFVREALARVVLLTDGLPSVGIREAARLGTIAEEECARGVTTTTMGIGEGFDDELLGELARRGKGGFYYLATPEAIPAAFGRELEGVFAIVATGVELKVVPEPDVTSVEVLHRMVTRAGGDGLVVELGGLAANAPRQVLLRMNRSATDTRLLAKVAVTFRDGAGRAADAHLTPVAMKSDPAPADVAEIILERMRLLAASAIDDAWARRASGQRDEAIAALSRVKAEIHAAREQGLAPRPPLDELIGELAGTEAALASAASEAEHHRRSARERSQITFLGQSHVGPRPRPPSDDD